MLSKLLSHLEVNAEDPFESVFADAPIFLHSIDADGRLLNVSRFWAEFLGYAREEMIGRRSIEFLTEESRRRAVEKVLPRFFAEGRLSGVNYDFVRKDGAEVPVTLAATAQYGADGSFRRSLAVLFDNSESRRAQEILARSQKLETIGQLAGGVAHDFNNLLCVVQGNLELMRDLDDDGDRGRCLEAALDAVKRGAELTQQLLSFGRRARLAPEAVRLDEALSDAWGLSQRLVQANVRLERRATEGLWEVRIDPHQLETALANLVINARDAMPQGGVLRLSLENRRLTAEEAARLSDTAVAGPFVMLEVRDDGVGMSEEVASRAFDPFFTTKPAGAGSGLGLSMVQGFATQSGGGAVIESRCGEGCAVRLFFPAASAAAADGEPSGPGAAPPSPPEPETAPIRNADARRVLVVEDQDDVRRVVVAQLRASGLRVLEATSGDVARNCLMAGLAPDLILTDLEMPGRLQGVDLALLARDLDPAIAIIALSGRLNPEDAARLPGDAAALSKPIAREALLAAVAEALGRRVSHRARPSSDPAGRRAG